MNEYQASVLRGISNHDQTTAELRDILASWGAPEWHILNEFLNIPAEDPNEYFLKLCCINAVRSIMLAHDAENSDAPG